jgi:hypothetical protein
MTVQLAQATLYSVPLLQPFTYGKSDRYIRFATERLRDEFDDLTIIGFAIPKTGGEIHRFVEVPSADRMVELVQIDSCITVPCLPIT